MASLTTVLGTITGSGPAPANNLLTGLIAYWSLDEASGTRADSHTNGFDLTDNATVGSTAGILGNAADFVAANSEYFNRADDPLLRFNINDYSISFWVNFAAFPTDETGSYYIAQKDDATNRSFGVNYISNNASTDNGGRGIAVVVGSGGGSRDFLTVIDKGFLTAAQWEHIVIVKRTAGKVLEGYLNGSLVQFENYVVSAGDNPTKDLVIGTDNFSGVPTNFFDDPLDEIGIWSRALTADEVTFLYNSGAALAYSGFETGGTSYS